MPKPGCNAVIESAVWLLGSISCHTVFRAFSSSSTLVGSEQLLDGVPYMECREPNRTAAAEAPQNNMIADRQQL
jgi:hypothetical protein